MTIRFSVIIPAYNEAGYLPRLLDSLELARDRYRGGRHTIEVIVGNNGSTDETAALAMARGCTVVDVEKRAIAAARNGAARSARGEILCFVDADSVVHPDTFNAIEEVMQAGRCIVGATGVRLERMSLGIRVTWVLLVPLTRLLAVDTGVVFCRREDFEAVGGYREELLAAEDVDFLFRIKRLGRGTLKKRASEPGPITPQSPGIVIQRGCHRTLQGRALADAGFKGEAVNLQHTFLALSLAVHPANEFITVKNRQAEIAVLAFACRHITFKLVVEPEQVFQSAPVDHQIIERGQEVNPPAAQAGR